MVGEHKMTNFDFLKKDEKFSSFADVAITAERLYNVDLASCVFNVRRATEFAVKWMYSVDGSLVMPYQDSFVTLINTVEFKDIVGSDIFRRIDFIRLVGNSSAHSARNIKAEQAELAFSRPKNCKLCTSLEHRRPSFVIGSQNT